MILLLLIYIVSVFTVLSFSLWALYTDWNNGLDTTYFELIAIIVVTITPILNTWFVLSELIETLQKLDTVVIKGKE